ncbi:MAG: MarR family transcriptional regulator [Planctomycetales bacterium]|nr:MarR family transcriptional regulator [Planctomycetales bacterium]
MKSGVKNKRIGKASQDSESAAKEIAKAEVKPKDSGARWTFLTNHSHVLIVLHAEPDMVLREVATRVGITERAVQRVVQDLEEGGFIRRERVGRKNHYEVLTDLPLRHPIESHRNIGDLLKLVTG